jgi:hypothetical protein
MLQPPKRIRADSGRFGFFRCCLRRQYRVCATMKTEPVGPYENFIYTHIYQTGSLYRLSKELLPPSPGCFCFHKYVIRSCIDVQFFETSISCRNVLGCVLGLPGAWCLVLVPVPDLNLKGNFDY